MTFTINNYNVLSKAAICFLGYLGYRDGCKAYAAHVEEWDLHALKIAKRWKAYEAAHAPSLSAKKEGGVTELAPGVPLPAELQEIANAM